MQNRTDLALELKEEKNIGSAQSGIIVKTRIDTTNHIKETKIIIKNKKGEDSLGKPKGTYITIEAKDLSTNDGSFHKEMSEALFLNLKEMLNKKKKILIAGLGNAGVTADSLGPKVVNNLYITRHLQKEGIGNYQFELSAIAPGVMAQTGIETSEILESLADKLSPYEKIACNYVLGMAVSNSVMEENMLQEDFKQGKEYFDNVLAEAEKLPLRYAYNFLPNTYFMLCGLCE